MTTNNGECSIHSSLEDHVRDAICPRCKKEVEKPWKSVFWSTFHYLTNKCDHCAYELFYRNDKVTSGVDE